MVDDHPDSAELFCELLAAEGFETSPACSGEQAFRRAAELRPDVILLDLGLPDMDGLTVAEELRKQPAFDRTLVIATSGHSDGARREAAQRVGIDVYLVKPVSIPALLSAMENEPKRSLK